MFFKKSIVFLLCFFLYNFLLFSDSSFLPEVLTDEKDTSKLILVAIQEQVLGCYEYGRKKISYPISSGVEKNLSTRVILKELGECPTPRGRFSIFYKTEYQISSIYGSPMPWMLAFTRKHTIHAGNLPGYPASHGCIRLSEKHAKKLFSWADIGTVILIVNSLKELGI